MDDNTERIQIELDTGEQAAHVITLIVVARMDSFDDQVRVITTPQTSRIVTMGALTEAMEQMRYPEYYDDDGED